MVLTDSCVTADCRVSNLLEFKLGGEAAGCVLNGPADEGGSEAAVTEMR